MKVLNVAVCRLRSAVFAWLGSIPLVRSTYRWLRRRLLGQEVSAESCRSNTLSFQKSHWRDEILRYGLNGPRLYGYDWGDPEEAEAKEADGTVLGNYLKIKDEYLLPFLGNSTTVLEIGSCGGKWTQYLLRSGKVVCVDLNDEFFDYIRRKLPAERVTFYKTSGAELWGVEGRSVDFIFSMDTFVRIPKGLISSYFAEFARVLKPGGRICLHLPCSDMPDSVRRRFIDLSSEEIRDLCLGNGFRDFVIDRKTIRHGVILKVNYSSRDGRS